MGHLRRLSLALILCAFIVTPAEAHPRSPGITVQDDHGTRLTLSAPPQRLISLAPNVTEMLFALGLGSRVVGVSSYSTYPAAATRLPVVFSYTSLNVEKILSLRPDLVVAASIVPQADITKLRSVHLHVLMTDPHTIAGILRDIHLLGVADGVSSRADGLVARLETRIDRVTAVVRRAATRPRVFYEVDPTLYTAGHGSFIDSLITLAGGTNIAGSISNPYPQLSAERLLSADPQVYVLGDSASGMTPAKVVARRGFAAINAVKLHHVYRFNDDLASRPGPRIVDGLEALARLVHPELFR